MNTKFYIITLIISLLLMMPSCFISDCGWVNLLSSIGCSGFAAAVMAIFLEKNMEKRKERFKETYFYPLFNELNIKTIFRLIGIRNLNFTIPKILYF